MTWGELFDIQPFGNSLVSMDLTGDQVYRVLEQQWAGQPFPRILQISGFSYTWSPSAPRGGQSSHECCTTAGWLSRAQRRLDAVQHFRWSEDVMRPFGEPILDEAVRRLVDLAFERNQTFFEMDERLEAEIARFDFCSADTEAELWHERAMYEERRTGLFWQLGYCRVDGQFQFALRAMRRDRPEEGMWIYPLRWAPRTVRLVLSEHLPDLMQRLAS